MEQTVNQEQQSRQLRNKISGFDAELAELKNQKLAKDLELRKKEMDVQRKKDAMMSASTELKRLDTELQVIQVE